MVDFEKFKEGKKYSKWRNRLFHQFPVKLYQKITNDPVVFYHYAGKKILSYEKTNLYIYESLKENRPIMVSRFGGVESSNIETHYLNEIQGNLSVEKEYAFERLHLNAGFFPKNIELQAKFCEIYLDASKYIDLLAVWNMAVEPYAIKYCMSKESKLTALYFIEPWFTDKPWTRALAGKKVLVVHPFAESIRKQYEKRKLLFKNEDYLPEFELKVFKAVQTIAGEKDERFSDWFEALAYMEEEVLKIDFDVAIVGCGAYGMPLAASIRKTNRSVIHLAGATQLMFGIWGNRWNSLEKYKDLRNEHWILPSKEETPANAEVVEGHTYW